MLRSGPITSCWLDPIGWVRFVETKGPVLRLITGGARRLSAGLLTGDLKIYDLNKHKKINLYSYTPYQKPNCESECVLYEIMSLGFSEKWPLAKLYFTQDK